MSTTPDSTPTYLERWLAPTRRRVLLSLVFAALYAAYLTLCIVPANTDDDWSIALLLSGRIPAEGGLAPFINAALARVIHALFVWQPSVNWYFVVEHASAFLALWALAYAMISFVRLAPGLVALGFTCCFVMPFCITESNFTVVAGIATAAGALLLLSRMYHPRAGIPSAVAGILLLALGFMWRPKMCIVVAPFVLLTLLWKLYLRTHDYHNPASLRTVAASLMPFVLAAAACGALFAYDHQAWQQPEWQAWLSYNDARAGVADYPMPEYGEIASDLAELGVSENDYDMLRIYMSADIDVLNTELVSKVAALRPPLVSGPAAVIDAARAYTGVIRSRLIYFGCIGAIFLLLWPRDKRGYLVAALQLACAFALCTYLLLMQRQVDRAETPVWLYAVVCCVALASTAHPKQEEEPAISLPLAPTEDAPTILAPQDPAETPAAPANRWQRAEHVGNTLLVTLALAACAVGVAKPVKDHLHHASLRKPWLIWHQDSYQPTDVFSTYIARHEGQSYVLGILQYYRLEEGYQFAYLPAPSIAQRTMSTGGWSTGSPYRAYQASLCGGATNPIASLLQPEGQKSLLIAAPEIADRVLTFVHEHYDENITMQQLEEIEGGGRGDIKVYVWEFNGTKK